ncbi:MAG: hypothetical protein AAFQ94_05695 [Bacteroidota bacterium]
MSYGKNLILSLVCILMITANLNAQTENGTLNEQFTDVLENTESFKQYKVVPKTRLDGLFRQVGDSMRVVKSKVTDLRGEVNQQKETIESLEAQLGTVTSDLDQSNLLNDSISFLGITFQKAVYNVIVWGLIVALLVAGAFIYMLFKRSHKVTRTTQNDLKRLTDEFDGYKTKAHEKQVKLKRELQTAMNTLHEKGIKV